MKRHATCWGIVLLGSLVLAGCGSNGEANKDQKPTALTTFADTLQQQRAELAKQADTLWENARTRDIGRRRGTVKLEFLPGWYEPLVVPCVHDGKFNANLGLFLPSYVPAEKAVGDRALAQLYARFGDHEAAVKLAGGQSSPELDSFKLETSIPVEWTRLMAIQLYTLEQQIAIGELRAFKEFFDLHDELAKVLTGKSRTSAVGRTLLSHGRSTVTQAAVKLRATGKTELADQADTWLKNTADVLPRLNIAGSQAHWSEQLHAQPQGAFLLAVPAQRALDLMHLPISREAVEAVLVFFDGSKNLSELVVTYTPGLRRECEQAAEVVAGLNAQAAPTIEVKNGPVTHKLEGLTAEATLCRVNETFGGWVRVQVKASKPAGPLPRDVGTVHLENAYETTRLTVAPQLQIEPLVIDDDKLLKKLENPLPAAKLTRVDLKRVEGQDLLREVHYRLQSGRSLHEVAAPLFARLGVPRLANEADAKRTNLTLTWEDAATQWLLVLPDDVREPTLLTLRDRREAAQNAERVAAVTAHEKAERARRIQDGKPFTRLPRKLEQFPLGMAQPEFMKFIPVGRSIVRRELSDAVIVAINSPAPPDRPYLARQIVARFDGEKRLSWLHVRYEVGTTQARATTPWTVQLLSPWRAAGGAVNANASPYAALESDLPPPNPAGKHYAWHDDLTHATCLLDASGVELTVWNRPPDDASPTPFTYLPNGMDNVRLGMPLSQAKAAFGGEPEALPDGSLVFRPGQGPYDAVVVWVEKEQIVRLAGRFRVEKTATTKPSDLEKQLMTQWGSEIAKILWPTRRDFQGGKVLQALIWHDDATRYRLYWAESENSPARLWAEWKGK